MHPVWRAILHAMTIANVSMHNFQTLLDITESVSVLIAHLFTFIVSPLHWDRNQDSLHGNSPINVNRKELRLLHTEMSYQMRYAKCFWSSLIKVHGTCVRKYLPPSTREEWEPRVDGIARTKADLHDLEDVLWEEILEDPLRIPNMFECWI